jgi:hypothetical protein
MCTLRELKRGFIETSEGLQRHAHLAGAEKRGFIETPEGLQRHTHLAGAEDFVPVLVEIDNHAASSIYESPL